MLDDPRVNFAISTRASRAGLDHFGIQVETAEELQEVYGRLEQARNPKSPVSPTRRACPGEAFLTTGESTVYGDDIDLGPVRTPQSVCCVVETHEGACCAPGAGQAAEETGCT